jgi:CTP synthase
VARTPRLRSKFIFITGGVVSSLGKGITISSLGILLQSRGLKVNVIKLDPYLNVDAGTMNPYQHGEVYVTEDGAETDLDLGHYERFLDITTSRRSNVTTGQIYDAIIRREREGQYLGDTVQVIPHVTDEIKNRITELARSEKGTDITLVEVGGTVGDIESLPFLEAIRQFALEVGRRNSLFVHVTLLPWVQAAGELKTKPTQHSVMRLREIGIQPDFLVCRNSTGLVKGAREKLGLFCNVLAEDVIDAADAESIYTVPLEFERQGLGKRVLEKLGIRGRSPDLGRWDSLVERIRTPEGELEIAVCGKYVELTEAYKSISEALYHAGFDLGRKVRIRWVDSEKVTADTVARRFEGVDGILIPGGFGDRGIEGKIEAARHARETLVPFFGICLGMQVMVIEFARSICGLKNANSSEFGARLKHPVIDLMMDQRGVKVKGASMRLGAWPCVLDRESRAFRAYKREVISERHRHRYEVNNRYREILVEKGLRLCGLSPDNELVEMVELSDHPWFVGCQFHPELKSRVMKPHPLFRDFVRAALKARTAKDSQRETTEVK